MEMNSVVMACQSRETGGWIPWTDEDMARYREHWPIGSEARLRAAATLAATASRAPPIADVRRANRSRRQAAIR